MFEAMHTMMNHVEFEAFMVATTAELQEDVSLKFMVQRMVVLPPFLAKALMDADAEDVITLMMVA